jgi:hypothetical protein
MQLMCYKGPLEGRVAAAHRSAQRAFVVKAALSAVKRILRPQPRVHLWCEAHHVRV